MKTKIEKMSRPQKQGRAAKGKQLCWHISRFQQRYELPDDVRYSRKSPLQYTKDFCSGMDDESCSYFRSVMSLRIKSDWLLLQGAFVELKRIAANYSKVYRGFLLNSNFEPATDDQVGCWLGLKNGQANHVLKELSSVGLIEQVTAPDFKRLGDKENKSKKRKKPKVMKRNKKQTRPKKDFFRSRSETHGNARNALNKKDKIKNKIKDKANAYSVSNGNGKNKIEIINGKAIDKINALKGQSQQQAGPLTAESTKPSQSEAPRGRLPVKFSVPSTSIKQTEPQKLFNIAQGILHRYSPEAKSFASDVFEALQLSCHPLSKQGKREAASFASIWMKAEYAGLSPPALAQLRERAIAESRRIIKNWNNRQGKPAAVFCDVFAKMLSKAKIENKSVTGAA
jgi:hypothetical protein